MPERNSKIETQIILESSRNRLIAGNARSICPHAKESQVMGRRNRKLYAAKRHFDNSWQVVASRLMGKRIVIAPG